MARKSTVQVQAEPVAEVEVAPEPTVVAEALAEVQDAPESSRTYVRWDVPSDTEAYDAEMARLLFELGNARKRVAGHADKGRTPETHPGMAQALGWVLRTERKIAVLTAAMAAATEAQAEAESAAA